MTYLGQVFGAEADAPDGGNAVFQPYPAEYDAGIAALMAAFPAEGEPVDLETPIEIRGATVVATNFAGNFEIPGSQSRFWLADGAGTVEVRMDFNDVEGLPMFPIRVGHKIDLDVTQVDQYFGAGQVTKGTNWNLVEVNQDVYIFDVDRELTEADLNQVVRVTGTLEGAPEECGPDQKCWNSFNYGHGVGILRTKSDFAEPGKCLTFVGPMRLFQGTPQFDTINFTWMRIYND
ncbi:MAG: hypothetical protein KC613_13465 [Myxococcales bacterium]|nr:hypothetical protein [Myxococcales bacterium]